MGIWVAVFGLTFLAIAIQTALFVAPAEEDEDYVVEVRSQAQRTDPAEGHETVTLVIDLPDVAHVTVLDKRWDHPSEHPQGFRFAKR